MAVKMPQLTNVICLDCNTTDQAFWSDFGSEQPCLNCNAPAVNLVKAVK